MSEIIIKKILDKHVYSALLKNQLKFAPIKFSLKTKKLIIENYILIDRFVEC